jgi:chorismate mutase
MDIQLNLRNLTEWGIPFEHKLIVAGPCSAESADQVMQTAKALKEHPVHVLRAGVWKPRTRPGSFEGVGAVGLKWLKAASKETGLPVTVEVATPQQVAACLKQQIDILWIGARTTPNPFAMQEIADALKGVDIPVMVKNPINSDLQLWIGALERLNMAGITRLLAVHRGFSSYQTDVYRNSPLWRIPLELKRLVPNLPLICDPSHICGNTELIPGVAQKAMDLLFDGLMIEVHIDPQSALSDAKQQLTPQAFGQLIKNLKWKKPSTDSLDYAQTISRLRQQIDECDTRIIELLASRMESARQIAMQKMKNNISIFQPDRWSEVVKSRLQQAADKRLSEEFIHNVFQYIHEESIRQQEEVLTT